MYSASRSNRKTGSVGNSPMLQRKQTPNSPDIRKKKQKEKPTIKNVSEVETEKTKRRQIKKASSLEEDKCRLNSARSASVSAEKLFGRVVRSSSAPKQRDLITATLEIPGFSRQNSKDDSYSENLMLESMNSLSFRTTFPSRKLAEEQNKTSKKMAATMPSPNIRVSSAGNEKKRNSVTAKIGPCKCKACTLKREAQKEASQVNSGNKESTEKDTQKEPEKKISSGKLPAVKVKKPNQPKNKGKGLHSPLKENNPITVQQTTESAEKQKKPKKSKTKQKKHDKTKAKKDKQTVSTNQTEVPEKYPESEDDVTLVAEDLRNFADLRSVKLEMLHTPRRSKSVSQEEKEKLDDAGGFHGETFDKQAGRLPGEEEFTLHRSGTDMSCCSSFCFEEMKTHDHQQTIMTGDFGFLDFSKQMGGATGLEREETFDLSENENNRKVIKSRIGSRMDNTSGMVIQWKRGPMLGRGAFGTVWCGLTITGELIAVKQSEVIAMNIEKAQKEYEKIQSEVELLKSLSHPNIVGYLGTSLDGRVVSIFMQYIPGGSVAGILKKFGPLAEPVFARYARQIVDGISYLHNKNVIHRDIKGSNLMLMPNGTVKLIDFGCAKKIMNLNTSNSDLLLSMKGTPYWMAPEVINETGHGPKSDVWSVGCSVFEMAVARPPWSHLNKYAALFAISSGNPVPKLSEKFSSEARNFVSLCLMRNPEQRPFANQLLAHPFCTSLAKENKNIHDSSGVPRNSANHRSKRL